MFFKFWVFIHLGTEFTAPERHQEKLVGIQLEVRVSNIIGVVLKAFEAIARAFKNNENRQNIRKGLEFALWLSYTAYELT